MRSNRIFNLYRMLISSLGSQHWWPADSSFEVIIGAILTQNTNWKNVEISINNLKKANLLSPYSIYNCSINDLKLYIKPSGFYRVKSDYLKYFVKKFIEHYDGDISRLMEIESSKLRNWLLSIKGIGKETADSILLYALDRPIFVVDAYTKRIFLRHNLINKDADYKEIQSLVEKTLPKDTNVLGEFHALLVKVGKNFCKKKNPLCRECPLSSLLNTA